MDAKKVLNTMPALRIPFAVDRQDQLHNPTTAEKGHNYFCPACGSQVIFKQGEIRTAHFAHKVNVTCNQETIIHKTAKLRIQAVVHDWLSGSGNSPTIQRECLTCRKPIEQNIPEDIDSAKLEYRLRDGSIVDVVLMVRCTPRAAVEIRVSHAVDETKARKLSVPFIELDGNAVIENPLIWKPIVDQFKPSKCGQCKKAHSLSQDKIKRVAEACRIALPNEYYRPGLYKCWKCKQEIIVFTWPKNGIHDKSKPQRDPLPRTIQYRSSKTAGGKYWANTCPYCRSIQGDFYLDCEPDGPFFSLE